MDEIIPDRLISKKECQEMIDKAIDKHNKTATIISAILGGILLRVLLSWGIGSSRTHLMAAVLPFGRVQE